MESVGWSQEMGYRANRGPLGTYFLPTRSEPPFCGITIFVIYFANKLDMFYLEGNPKTLKKKKKEEKNHFQENPSELL